jgi:hypothetical protein
MRKTISIENAKALLNVIKPEDVPFRGPSAPVFTFIDLSVGIGGYRMAM